MVGTTIALGAVAASGAASVAASGSVAPALWMGIMLCLMPIYAFLMFRFGERLTEITVGFCLLGLGLFAVLLTLDGQPPKKEVVPVEQTVGYNKCGTCQPNRPMYGKE